jgi:hypothetical protein
MAEADRIKRRKKWLKSRKDPIGNLIQKLQKQAATKELQRKAAPKYRMSPKKKDVAEEPYVYPQQRGSAAKTQIGQSLKRKKKYPRGRKRGLEI